MDVFKLSPFLYHHVVGMVEVRYLAFKASSWHDVIKCIAYPYSPRSEQVYWPSEVVLVLVYISVTLVSSSGSQPIQGLYRRIGGFVYVAGDSIWIPPAVEWFWSRLYPTPSVFRSLWGCRVLPEVGFQPISLHIAYGCWRFASVFLVQESHSATNLLSLTTFWQSLSVQLLSAFLMSLEALA